MIHPFTTCESSDYTPGLDINSQATVVSFNQMQLREPGVLTYLGLGCLAHH